MSAPLTTKVYLSDVDEMLRRFAFLLGRHGWRAGGGEMMAEGRKEGKAIVIELARDVTPIGPKQTVSQLPKNQRIATNEPALNRGDMIPDRACFQDLVYNTIFLAPACGLACIHEKPVFYHQSKASRWIRAKSGHH